MGGCWRGCSAAEINGCRSLPGAASSFPLDGGQQSVTSVQEWPGVLGFSNLNIARNCTYEWNQNQEEYLRKPGSRL